MDYRVLVVEDDQLPGDTDWVIVRRGGHSFFMIRRCRFSVEGGLCALLEEAWRTRVASEAPRAPVPIAV